MGASGNQGEDYTIDYSCLFDGSSAYLTKTFASAGNLKTWTQSFWMKRCDTGGSADQWLLNTADGGNTGSRLTSSDSKFEWMHIAGYNKRDTTQVFRDVSAWYHIVIQLDTTQGVEANRSKLWVNGEQVTAYSSATIDEDATTFINNTTYEHGIGRNEYDENQYFSGYLAEYVFIDGTALDADSFGETNSTTGQWIPKDVSALTFGQNGFYLDFADSTFLGKDASATSAAVTNKASTSSEWGGTTGAYTFATNEIDRSSTVNAIISTDLLSGDFNFNFTLTTSGGAVRIGVFDNQESNTFDGTAADGGLDSMTNSWYLDMGNEQFRYGGASQGSASGVANGSAITIQRTGSTIKITDDGSDAHTFSQTFSNPVRVIISGGGAAFALDSVQYTADEASGNDNSFFSSGLAAADQVVDTPTDNFCTWNPVNPQPAASNTIVLSDGNLNIVQGSTENQSILSTHQLHGKQYAECRMISSSNSGGTRQFWGVIEENTVIAGTYLPYSSNTFSGLCWPLYSSFSDGTSGEEEDVTLANGETVCIAISEDDGKFWVRFDDGDWFGGGDPETTSSTPSGTFSNITTGQWVMAVYNASDQNTSDFGQLGYAYTAPSGYETVSTANLDDPTIADPSAYVQATTYTGDGASSLAVNQGGNSTFEPDLVWIKNRDAADNHCWFDTARGAEELLSSNTTSAETTDADTLTAFDSDGFTVGADVKVNTDTEKYVGWQWLESATPGFDIVLDTGTGSAHTISHSLGVTPEFIIRKDRTATADPGWIIWHTSLPGANYYLNFDTGAQDTSVNYWNNTLPTSSVFSVGASNGTNQNTKTFVTYLFAGVENFSKFGKYTGNGSATDGPFIWFGFRPAYFLFKRIDSADNWRVYDNQRGPYNPDDARLEPNGSGAEASGDGEGVDFLSNGLKLKSSDSGWNASGGTYIFAAFADTPFKTANAR